MKHADTIFEHTQDALFLIDVGDDGTFTVESVNRAYEELTDDEIVRWVKDAEVPDGINATVHNNDATITIGICRPRPLNERMIGT